MTGAHSRVAWCRPSGGDYALHLDAGRRVHLCGQKDRPICVELRSCSRE